MIKGRVTLTYLFVNEILALAAAEACVGSVFVKNAKNAKKVVGANKKGQSLLKNNNNIRVTFMSSYFGMTGRFMKVKEQIFTKIYLFFSVFVKKTVLYTTVWNCGTAMAKVRDRHKTPRFVSSITTKVLMRVKYISWNRT